MKKLVIALLAAGATLTATAPAVAAQHCGRGFHRGPRGRCIRNAVRRPAPRLIVGHYYQGRGYWDGHRYYQHRYRYHNGWRYR